MGAFLSSISDSLFSDDKRSKELKAEWQAVNGNSQGKFKRHESKSIRYDIIHGPNKKDGEKDGGWKSHQKKETNKAKIITTKAIIFYNRRMDNIF
jgi:hypothetical protein